jgi:hypothetical protein
MREDLAGFDLEQSIGRHGEGFGRERGGTRRQQDEEWVHDPILARRDLADRMQRSARSEIPTPERILDRSRIRATDSSVV